MYTAFLYCATTPKRRFSSSLWQGSRLARDIFLNRLKCRQQIDPWPTIRRRHLSTGQPTAQQRLAIPQNSPTGAHLRCRPCSELRISRLIELAQQADEVSRYPFPEKSYYNHHNSFPELYHSAQSGCDFCKFIVDCYKETLIEEAGQAEGTLPENGPTGWIDTEDAANQSLFVMSRRPASSPVKIAIGASHLIFKNKFKDAEVFDTLMVEVDDFPLLQLNLIAPRGRARPSRTPANP